MTDPTHKIIDRALKSVPKGATAIVRYTWERGGNTRFAVNQVTSSGDIERATLAVTVQMGQRAATSISNQLDDASIDNAVARAAQLASLVPDDPEAQAPLGQQKYTPAKSSVDPATDKATAADRAKAVGAALAVAKDSKLVIAGFYQHGVRSVTLATSAGLWASHDVSTASLSCTARTTDGTGSGWAGQSSNRLADLDAHALAKTAADTALASAKPRKLEPGRYTVVLEPAAFSGLLNFLTDAFDARRADEGRSFFAKKAIGDALFDPRITLRTDPTDPAFAALPFDGEGLPLDKRAWIDKGKLGGLVYTRYWAAKQNKTATARPTAWILDGGSDDPLKGVDKGVLITRAWYLRMVDPQQLLVTGLTRDGVFLIENGQVAGPVNNFRFNESPAHVLSTCDALGASNIPGGTEGGGMRVPRLRAHDFNLASISEAV